MPTRSLAILLTCALALAGCVSLKRTSEARFFALRSLAERGPSSGTPAGVVGLLNVRLAGHLERPQLVTWLASNELHVDEYARWAEPLGDAVGRVLGENLGALLPDHQVAHYPWSKGARPLCRVVVEISSFAPRAQGDVVREGRWALLVPDQTVAAALKPIALKRPAGTDPTVSVEAMSQLLADLALEIAPAVRALPPPLPR